MDSNTAVQNEQDQDQHNFRIDEQTGKQDVTATDTVAATSTPDTATQAPASMGTAQAATNSALFPPDEAQTLRSRWDEIQTGFVDEPHQAVEQADALVAEAMQRLGDLFAQTRSDLEGQWSRGDDVSTEDLRMALQRYRSFFGRLLSV